MLRENDVSEIYNKNIIKTRYSPYLGRQLFPVNSPGFMQVYQDTLECDYGYLVIDTSPHGNEKHCLHTRIFARENPIVYRLKSM